LACSDGAVEASLFCHADGQWVVQQTCAEGEVCSTLPFHEGDDTVIQGQCSALQEECVEVGPEGRFCSENGTEVLECSTDLTKTDYAGSCALTGCTAGHCRQAVPLDHTNYRVSADSVVIVGGWEFLPGDTTVVLVGDDPTKVCLRGDICPDGPCDNQIDPPTLMFYPNWPTEGAEKGLYDAVAAGVVGFGFQVTGDSLPSQLDFRLGQLDDSDDHEAWLANGFHVRTFSELDPFPVFDPSEFHRLDFSFEPHTDTSPGTVDFCIENLAALLE
jgi:hypothetical protein